MPEGAIRFWVETSTPTQRLEFGPFFCRGLSLAKQGVTFAGLCPFAPSCVDLGLDFCPPTQATLANVFL